MDQPSDQRRHGTPRRTLGAGAALLSKRMDNAHARESERRRQNGELLAQFLEVTDRMWRLNQEWESLRVDIGQYPVGAWRHPDEEDSEVGNAENLDRHRRLSEAYEGAQKADAEAGVLLGRMQLLGLSVASPAEDLQRASAYYRYSGEPEVTRKREEALAAYMKAALPLTTS